jgi:hypothetical protein
MARFAEACKGEIAIDGKSPHKKHHRAIGKANHVVEHCSRANLPVPQNKPQIQPSHQPLKPSDLRRVESMEKTHASKVDMRFHWQWNQGRNLNC